MRRRLTAVAVERGEYALQVFRDVVADGEITPQESCIVLDALVDWLGVDRAAAQAARLADAVECGAGMTEWRYVGELISGYRDLLDELPEEVA